MSPTRYPSRSDLGPVYEAANYGDSLHIWVEPRFTELFGSLGVYDHLRQLLREELGVSPSPATQALHVRLLRGQPLDEPPRPGDRLGSVQR